MHIALLVAMHVHTCSRRDQRHCDASCLSIMPFEVARKERRECTMYARIRRGMRALVSLTVISITRKRNLTLIDQTPFQSLTHKYTYSICADHIKYFQFKRRICVCKIHTNFDSKFMHFMLIKYTFRQTC